MYDIWRFKIFLLFSWDFIWWLIQAFINAHLAVYLIWRMASTAKGAKMNTSQNVIHLQLPISMISFRHYLSIKGNIQFIIWIIAF